MDITEVQSNSDQVTLSTIIALVVVIVNNVILSVKSVDWSVLIQLSVLDVSEHVECMGSLQMHTFCQFTCVDLM